MGKQADKAPAKDQRKYDVDDKIIYTWEGEEIEAVVYGVQYQEDLDGNRHSFVYIVRAPEAEEGDEKTDTDLSTFNVLDASMIVKKI